MTKRRPNTTNLVKYIILNDHSFNLKGFTVLPVNNTGAGFNILEYLRIRYVLNSIYPDQ